MKYVLGIVYILCGFAICSELWSRNKFLAIQALFVETTYGIMKIEGTV